MRRIDFTYNWNNKLDCKCFTSIRVRNDKKFIIGENYMIFLNDKFLSDATIVDIKNFKIENLNNFMAHIDTGYSIDQTIKILQKMYKENFDKQEYSFILFKKK